jgi:pyruvate/2-oxoglutarate dehydrogenase complex dihydrolipoamide dehydrogenase (E3) component
MYRRFGSEVTIVEMGPRLFEREDKDVSEAVQEILEPEGMQIRLNAKCISLAKRDSGITVRMECTEGPPEIPGTHALLMFFNQSDTRARRLSKSRWRAASSGHSHL